MNKLRTTTKTLTRTLVLPGLALLLAIGTAPALAGQKQGDRHQGASKHQNSGKHISKSHNSRVGKHHSRNKHISKSHDSRAGRHHSRNKHISVTHNSRVSTGHRRGGHYRNRGYKPRYYGGYRHNGRGHHRRYQSSWYFGTRPYYSPFFGAALVSGAITHSLYHLHDGATCYDRHETDYRDGGSRNYSEVAGCHRIEQLSDGTQRRVEVPISQCN
ncbi:MAG: hypothetical protein ACI9JM_002310 [Halioglobus sp.]|jgi:hypothetical protein